MKRISIFSAIFMLIAAFGSAYGANDGSISGVVKSPSGAPFRGAFVTAQSSQSKITVNVLSDS
ncbi:MAG TPA: carboxypeptidase-like regulatory domain-containing protein, partial [Verrucomicrobiae bacterium]|nr:carboxypeptidase-like regulatory domain-containing protein [Verrucomicrobiae bacterium]